MVSELLKQAIQLSRAGHKLQAREILKRILVEEPTNETAWLWFIDSLPSDHERVIALEGLLRINPESRVARIGLAEYRRRDGAQRDTDASRLERSYHLDLPDEQRLIDEFDNIVREKIDQYPDYSSHSLEKYPDIEEDVRDGYDYQRGYSMVNIPKKSGLLLGKLTVLIFLTIGLLVIIGMYLASAGWANRIPVLKVFVTSTAQPCTCAVTDVYLVRVKTRIQGWKTNQSIYELDQAQGVKPVSIEYAQALLAEEELESPPECLSGVHDLTQQLLEYHVEYGLKLINGETPQADYYKKYVLDFQSRLASEFERISKEYRCVP